MPTLSTPDTTAEGGYQEENARPARYLSLFSGIGGFEQAMRTALPDAICAGFCEIDKHAIQVYHTHFPTHRNLGSVEDVHWDIDRDGLVDFVVGGPPCQDLTSANNLGHRTGLQGPRSKLFFEYARIVKECGARFFLMENVNRMASDQRDIITKTLESLGLGLCPPVKLDSGDFSAQRRVRMYWANFAIAGKDSLSAIESNQLTNILDHPSQISALELSQMAKDYMNRQVKGGRTHWQFGFHSDTANAKSATVTCAWAKGNPYNVLIDRRFQPHPILRRFSPAEAERLQGFPVDWTAAVAKTNRFRLLGNAAHVQVAAHALSALSVMIRKSRQDHNRVTKRTRKTMKK